MQNTNNKPAAEFSARNKKIAIVVARFNTDITDQLLITARNALHQHKVSEKNIQVVWVAGAMEIPLALLLLAKTKKYDCLIALGCVIRGETPHFDYVCKMAQEGILKVSLDHSVPIGFGILTVNNKRQAEERFQLGAEATVAALELVATSQFSSPATPHQIPPALLRQSLRQEKRRDKKK